MTLFEMYSLIEYITNKDFQGNVIKPNNFQQAISVVNWDFYKKCLGLPEEYQPGRPIPREYPDITQANTDKIYVFKKFSSALTVTAGKLPYPNDYVRESAITYNLQRTIDGENTTIPRPVEILNESQLADRLGNYTKTPSAMNPVAVQRNDGFYIYPASIAVVNFAYWRAPVDPLFKYHQQTGYITEDNTSTEFEWPEIAHMDLFRLILGYVGINLQNDAIIKYAEMRKAQGI